MEIEVREVAADGIGVVVSVSAFGADVDARWCGRDAPALGPTFAELDVAPVAWTDVVLDAVSDVATARNVLVGELRAVDERGVATIVGEGGALLVELVGDVPPGAVGRRVAIPVAVVDVYPSHL